MRKPFIKQLLLLAALLLALSLLAACSQDLTDPPADEAHRESFPAIGISLVYPEAMYNLNTAELLSPMAADEYCFLYGGISSHVLGLLAQMTAVETEEQFNQLYELINQEVFLFLSILRVPDHDPQAAALYEQLSQDYAHLEELGRVGENNFYLAYNDDISGLTLTSSERQQYQQAIDEIDRFREGITLFAPEPAADGSEPPAAPQIGSFSLQDLDGNPVSEAIFAEAELTMVNIWTTWCGPCVEEMPTLAALAQQLPENVQIYGICKDAISEDARVLARQILADAGADFPVLVPDQAMLEGYLNQVSQAVPTTLFFDRNGQQVGEAVVGAPAEGALEYYLQEIAARLPK